MSDKEIVQVENTSDGSGSGGGSGGSPLDADWQKTEQAIYTVAMLNQNVMGMNGVASAMLQGFQLTDGGSRDKSTEFTGRPIGSEADVNDGKSVFGNGGKFEVKSQYGRSVVQNYNSDGTRDNTVDLRAGTCTSYGPSGKESVQYWDGKNYRDASSVEHNDDGTVTVNFDRQSPSDSNEVVQITTDVEGGQQTVTHADGSREFKRFINGNYQTFGVEAVSDKKGTEEVVDALNNALDSAAQEDKAKGKLDWMIDNPDRNLSESDRAEMKDLAHAILEGNDKAVQDLIQKYQNNPEKLQRLMNELKPDLAKAGISAYTQFKNNALTVTMHNDSNVYAQFSTNPAVQPVSGKMVPTNHVDPITGTKLSIGKPHKGDDNDPGMVMTLMGYNAIAELAPKKK